MYPSKKPQVASGRFGVTPQYLVSADQLEVCKYTLFMLCALIIYVYCLYCLYCVCFALYAVCMLVCFLYAMGAVCCVCVTGVWFLS